MMHTHSKHAIIRLTTYLILFYEYPEATFFYKRFAATNAFDQVQCSGQIVRLCRWPVKIYLL